MIAERAPRALDSSAEAAGHSIEIDEAMAGSCDVHI